MIDSKTSKVFRGIAILMVIGSHFAQGIIYEPMRPIAHAFVASLGIYGVDIFFLLSGYGLVKSAAKNGIDKRFVIRRLMNTYVPYLLVYGVFDIIDKNIDSFSSFIKMLVGLDLWYMNVIFIFYILFMVFYKIGKFKEVLITIGVLLVSVLFYKQERLEFWYLSNMAFLIGIYAATLESKFGEKLGEWIKKINLTVIGATIAIAFWFGYSVTGDVWLHLGLSTFFSIAVLGLCTQIKTGGIILPLVGQYSLFIYLLHLRIFWKMIVLLEGHTYLISAVVAGIVILVSCSLIGYVYDYLTKKMMKNL